MKIKKLTRYGFDKLEKHGDCVAINFSGRKGLIAARTSAYQYASYNDFRVITRTEDGILYVWRVDADKQDQVEYV